jgi:DNA-binding MarR family transcriptional regulator
MTDRRAPNQITDELGHLASAMLAARRFGLVWTQAISARVGNDYTDNASSAILSTLRADGPLRLRDLTSGLGVPGPTLSRVVDRLVDNGDLKRSPGPAGGDGRAVLIEITAVGVEREQGINQAIYDHGSDVGLDLKETVAHLEHLVDDAASDAAPVPHDRGGHSIAGALAWLGITLGDTLRSISPSGDITEALTLLAFVEDEHSRPSIIAERVGLSSGGTTKVLDRLESAGLIGRTFGTAGDRRGVDLHLTAEGGRQLRIMSDAAKPFLPALLAAFQAAGDELDRAA